MGHLDRIQVKTAAVEIDGDLKMGTRADSIGPFWSRGPRGMQPFRHGTGDAMFERGHLIRHVPGKQLGRLDHRRQAAVGRPMIQRCPTRLAQPGLRELPRSRHDSFNAHARPVFRVSRLIWFNRHAPLRAYSPRYPATGIWLRGRWHRLGRAMPCVPACGLDQLHD